MYTIPQSMLTPLFRPWLRSIRHAMALLIAMSMLGAATPASSSPTTDSRLVQGIVSFTGHVMVNEQSAISGQTLFRQSQIVTGAESESLIMLRNLTRLHLSAQTDVTIDSDEKRMTGALRGGQLIGIVPKGVLLDFSTADSVIRTTLSTEPLVFTIDASECDGTTITVSASEIEVRTSGQTRLVKAGESFSTLAPSSGPQATQHFLSKKKKLGLLFGIGSAIAVLLAVALGKNDKDQQNPGGGCVIAPSPGSPSGCP